MKRQVISVSTVEHAALASGLAKLETRVRLSIEIVNTGSELMLGLVLNTHQHWMCAQLAARGFFVERQTAVGDASQAIQDAVRDSLGRARVAMVTGGLGPTSDDLTVAAVAGLLGRKLVFDAKVMAHVEKWHADRCRPMAPSARVQAMAPEGATVLENTHGTAPGFLIRVDPNPFSSTGSASWIVLLPGPPRELHPMFADQVMPWLGSVIEPVAGYECRTLRATGIGESMVQERIAGPLNRHVESGLQMGYCSRPGEVDVRFAAHGPDGARLVADATRLAKELLDLHVFGGETDSIEEVVVRLLTARGRTLVVAESCTGGHLANRITNVPGASVVLLGGMVTYSNELKQRLLGVRPETLAAHGAVSEPTAREMAEGARSSCGADFALATTGIAGPGGGTEEKPVGTVYIALATAARTEAARHANRYDRATFKHLTSQQALDMLRRELMAR